jgi:hypothetical protein
VDLWQLSVVALSGVVAAISGVVGMDAKSAAWWRYWAPEELRRARGLLVTAHFAVGVIAALAGQSLGWYTFSDDWQLANAVMYAAAGEALFRIEVSGFSLNHIVVGHSLLRTVLRYTARRANDEATRAVEELLAACTDERLAAVAYKVVEEVYARPGSSDGARIGSRELLEDVVKLGRILHSVDISVSDDKRARSRSEMAALARNIIVENGARLDGGTADELRADYSSEVGRRSGADAPVDTA